MRSLEKTVHTQRDDCCVDRSDQTGCAEITEEDDSFASAYGKLFPASASPSLLSFNPISRPISSPCKPHFRFISFDSFFRLPSCGQESDFFDSAKKMLSRRRQVCCRRDDIADDDCCTLCSLVTRNACASSICPPSLLLRPSVMVIPADCSRFRMSRPSSLSASSSRITRRSGLSLFCKTRSRRGETGCCHALHLQTERM